jgi:monoamine oxidase
MRNIDLALTRRGLLVGAAALSTASCCPAWAADIDVVVVGAGAAGIGAAQMLASLGRNCVVVEADKRIGGRALTDTRTFPLPFDIGCAWIHAAPKNPFYGFALEKGFHLHHHDLSVNELYYRGKQQSAAMVEKEHDAEFMIGAAMHAKVKEGEDVPGGSLVPTLAPPMDAAATYMGPMDAAVDLDNESVFDASAESEAEYDPNFLVKEGFGSLVAWVGRGLHVRLSTPVTAIRYDGKGVTVETGHGTIAAKTVSVTVSTGVLQKDAVAFTPHLPVETLEAIDALKMGLLTKIPLWIQGVPHTDFGIKPYDNIVDENPAANARDNFYFVAWPWDSNLMVGFIGGQYAWDLAKEPEDAIKACAIDRLAEMFGSDIRAKVRQGLVTGWGANPLTHGAYSAQLPKHHGAREALRRPVADRVFFAGEAVAENGLFATCGGAYLSGESVARAVHATLEKAGL